MPAEANAWQLATAGVTALRIDRPRRPPDRLLPFSPPPRRPLAAIKLAGPQPSVFLHLSDRLSTPLTPLPSHLPLTLHTCAVPPFSMGVDSGRRPPRTDHPEPTALVRGHEVSAWGRDLARARSVLAFRRQPYYETLLALFELRIDSVVSQHRRDHLVADAHPAKLHVAVVAHDVDERLIASVTKAGP